MQMEILMNSGEKYFVDDADHNLIATLEQYLKEGRHFYRLRNAVWICLDNVSTIRETR